MLKTRFNKRLEGLADSILTIVGRIEAYKGQWIGGAKLNPQTLGRLKKSTLITSAGASTRIEGAKLSDEEVEKLMQGVRVQKFVNRDKQEVRGYYELLENVFDSWKSIKFSESSTKHFHKELLKYVDKDARHCGDYKSVENDVKMIDADGNVIAVIFKTTPAYLAPKQMQELYEWTESAFKDKRYHPLLIIANFIVEFLAIHPFQDGNGRLSRVLTNFLLLKHGYEYVPYVSHEKLVEENKSEYYIALRRSQKTFNTPKESIAEWLSFFLKMILAQSERALELLSGENIEKLLSEKQIAVWQYLQTVSKASPQEIAEQVGVARPTVNQVLNVLLRFKKIERLGSGRSTRYKVL